MGDEVILDIFLVLFTLTILFTAIGFFADKPYLLGLGYIFLFVLGVTLAGINNPVVPTTGIEYKSGNTITTTGSTTTVTNVYTSYSNRTIGIFFGIGAIFAFILLLMQYRGER